LPAPNVRTGAWAGPLSLSLPLLAPKTGGVPNVGVLLFSAVPEVPPAAGGVTPKLNGAAFSPLAGAAEGVPAPAFARDEEGVAQ
jgi:hypothetical protein